MNRSRRPGVSAYLEAFLLIGVAAAGSAVVLAGGLRTVASAQGAGVSVSQGAIRQGPYFALETVLVRNTGDAPFAWFEVSTSGVSPSATYCYALYDPESLTTVANTCPAMSPNPGGVNVSAPLSPGRGVIFELTLTGHAFAVGTVSALTVTTSAGAQGTLGAVAVQA